MITDVPTATDFFDTGKGQMDIAWEMLTELLNHSERLRADVDEDFVQNFWKAAGKKVLLAKVLIAQGVELILKGKISEISPFILIKENPNKWGNGKKKTFSDYKTLDAIDLTGVLNAISPESLTVEVVEKFNKYRVDRNIIIHAIPEKIKPDAVQTVVDLLDFHTSLFPDESWASVRCQHIENGVNTYIYDDYDRNLVCNELALIIDVIPPDAVQKYFRIDKHEPAVYCPCCSELANDKFNFDHALARFGTDQGMKTAYCPICDKHFRLEPSPLDCECEGDTYNEEFNRCVLCNSNG